MIYIAKIDYLKNNNGFLGDDTFAYVMAQNKSIDIDCELDFKLAEVMVEELLRENK